MHVFSLLQTELARKREKFKKQFVYFASTECLNGKKEVFSVYIYIYICIQCYRPYLHYHFVITSFTSGWQNGGRAGCFAPGLLCAIVKRYEEYNKDSLDTEVTYCPYYLSVQAIFRSLD